VSVIGVLLRVNWLMYIGFADETGLVVVRTSAIWLGASLLVRFLAFIRFIRALIR